jgi:hypothetical protein
MATAQFLCRPGGYLGMSTVEGSSGRKRQIKLVAWTAVAALWFWIVVTDSTGTLTAGTVPEVAVGLAFVVAVVAVVAVRATAEQARSLSVPLLLVGGVAVALSVLGPTWVPVAAERLSLVGGLAVLCGFLLLLWTTAGAGEDSTST